MSKFTKALQSAECTKPMNGELSISKQDNAGYTNGRLSLLFKGVRNLNIPNLYDYLNKSSTENLIDTFCLVFHLRDCRGGKGERELGRKALVWLFLSFPVQFRKIVHLLPEYGRWDDMLMFWPNKLNISNQTKSYLCENYCVKIENITYLQQLQVEIVRIMGNQLELDKYNMEKGNQITLCAKWAPSENDKIDKQYHVVRTICSIMKWTPKNYRKIYLSPLREYINIVERLMCNNDWNSIDFSKVPSNAMHRLKKAFINHTPDKFLNWTKAITSGTSKINASQLYPHEIVSSYRNNFIYNEILEQQWKVLENKIKTDNIFKKALCIVDVSASMKSWGYHKNNKTPSNFVPLDVSLALGIIISNSIQDCFHNHIITFHNEPTFSVIPDGNLFSKIKYLSNIPWGGSTNLVKTFNLILNKCVDNNLPEEDMPEKIFIISDMQFNYCSNTHTNFQYIDEQYKIYGYKRPQLIFWNVNGGTDDFPVSQQDYNTALISGFSQSLIKTIFTDNTYSPYSILRETIDNYRYQAIKDAIEPKTYNHSSGPISTPSSNKVFLSTGACFN